MDLQRVAFGKEEHDRDFTPIRLDAAEVTRILEARGIYPSETEEKFERGVHGMQNW